MVVLSSIAALSVLLTWIRLHRRVFIWDDTFPAKENPDRAEGQVCQDHPDAFQVGACAQATVSFRQAPPTPACNPESVEGSNAGWEILGMGKRVTDPEEDRDESP